MNRRVGIRVGRSWQGRLPEKTGGNQPMGLNCRLPSLSLYFRLGMTLLAYGGNKEREGGGRE